MRSPALMMGVLSASVVLAGCGAPAADVPVVRVAEAVKPSPVRALDHVLPTPEELAVVLGSTGMMGQLVEGGPDMLLAGVGESDATPADCVSPTYRLEKVVYRGQPGAGGGEPAVDRRVFRRPADVRFLRRGPVRHTW